MQESMMEQLWRTSHLSGGNLVYVEQLYDSYLTDPNSVSEEWRSYFDQLPRVNGHDKKDIPHSTIREQFLHLSKNKLINQGLTTPAGATSEHEKKQVMVLQLINAYRIRGHQAANLDPLGLMERVNVPDLELEYHGLTEADLDTLFQTGNLVFGSEQLTLKQIIEGLKSTYCSSLGAEYMHIVDTSIRSWFQERIESVKGKPNYEFETRYHLLERLTAAEGLEKYLGSRYPGTKRFGLEGAESLIPMMDELIQRAGGFGAKEIVIGMAHRGRLNVLVNTLGKSPKDLFDEFDGKRLQSMGSGDVKYHQGFSSNVMTPGGEVHLALSFNPSHLEIVAPVVEGSVCARQVRRDDPRGETVVPIIMHGDAAFAGQGVVMETFQMSQTRAFGTGGSIHLIINNQVGFTTNKREDTRSTEYSTDVAKMIEAPILHVNGDDPEAVLFATQVAIDFRNQFKKDVVLDLFCYRRRGHNEADEPSGTQPLMYKVIKDIKTTRTIYAERLLNENIITLEQSKKLEDDYRKALDNGHHVTKSLVLEPNKSMYVDWTPFIGHEWTAKAKTAVNIKVLQRVGKKLSNIPEGFPIQRQVQKILEDRSKMTQGAMPLNWGYGEVMAYASLVNEGHAIRISGQDVGRGTFSHRHAVLHNQSDASTYIPLQHVKDGQPRFEIFDSFLSEEAVLAFEYGYATTNPNTLVIWEAQFGDFANGAQVVIDQFITSGEHKWGRLCGLTMLLPHGYEGQGPEHSSARIERYLQLCAEHNIQVCVPTTPAQIFHMLRRQVKRPLRKPLIAITPKSLLRHKGATSSLEDLSEGSFQTVIGDKNIVDPKKVKSVIMCSGKVYYDLLEYQQTNEILDTAVIRIEQLYPFPADDLKDILMIYPKLEDLVWCQEEPQNQGAWYSTQHRMRLVLKQIDEKIYLRYAGRKSSAAPAAGYISVHVEEQNALVSKAFTVKKIK
jgi:2-oxoglutarate dehydrogenase E1 component